MDGLDAENQEQIIKYLKFFKNKRDIGASLVSHHHRPRDAWSSIRSCCPSRSGRNYARPMFLLCASSVVDFLLSILNSRPCFTAALTIRNCQFSLRTLAT
jgi:hypothetical protein